MQCIDCLEVMLPIADDVGALLGWICETCDLSWIYEEEGY